MTYRWVKLRSWHLTLDGLRTLCGRDCADLPASSQPDGNDRTCERCYQIRESDR